MTWRMIQEISYHLDGSHTVSDILAAIQEQANSGRHAWLLAHADDGIIWGLWDGSGLQLSSQAFPEVSPPLRSETLWEARLFGPHGEWFAWRGAAGWLAREIRDNEGDPGWTFDESQVLWGMQAEDSRPPFTLLREGEQGIRHAPPAPFTGRHRLRLKVRHYLAEDSAGAVFVRLSRLVELAQGE